MPNTDSKLPTIILLNLICKWVARFEQCCCSQKFSMVGWRLLSMECQLMVELHSACNLVNDGWFILPLCLLSWKMYDTSKGVFGWVTLKRHLTNSSHLYPRNRLGGMLRSQAVGILNPVTGRPHFKPLNPSAQWHHSKRIFNSGVTPHILLRPIKIGLFSKGQPLPLSSGRRQPRRHGSKLSTEIMLTSFARADLDP